MTGEQLFLNYKDNGPKEYADVLLSIYLAISDRLFPLLAKADAENKRLAIQSNATDDTIGEISEDDIIFV